MTRLVGPDGRVYPQRSAVRMILIETTDCDIVIRFVRAILRKGTKVVGSADVDRIIEEVRRLAPEQKRLVREALDGEDQAKVQSSDRSVDLSRELRWIEKHRSEYAGQWVAVRGDRLLSSGADGREVYKAARAAGDERPFVTRVEPAT